MSEKSIDIIIENIIEKNKNEFNKKSSIEQNNDKYKISKEINGLLKGRNNDDRREILSILLEMVNDPTQSFIDLNGNIDIDKIKVLTNNSIKNAIEKGLIRPNTENKNFNNGRENTIKDVILTSVVINKMISNYESISIEEKQELWNQYSNLSRDEQRRLEKASSNTWYALAKNATSNSEKKHFENMGKVGEKISALYDKANSGDKKAQEELFKIMMSDKEFIKTYKDTPTKYSEELRNEFASFKGKQNVIAQEVMKITQNLRGEISQDDIKKITELIKQEKDFFKSYKTKYPNNTIEYSSLIDEYMYLCSERGQNLEKALGLINESKNELPKKNSEKLTEDAEKIESTPVLDDINSMLTSDQVDLSEEFPVEKTQEISSKEEISNALTIYKEYFQDFDEETIEAISEMTPEEIIANLKDDFDSMLEENQIDNKTKDALYLLADNLTSDNKNILLDSEKREVFFEKIQSGISKDEIKDYEISELFEKISVELQVGEIEQIQEVENSAPIEEIDAHKEFIEQHENFEIDPMWEEMCRDAQAKGKVLKGKTLIELLEKYKDEIDLADSEKKTNVPEDRGEKAGSDEQSKPETPLVETVEIQAEHSNIEEQENIGLTDEMLEESETESKIEHFGKKGKNERVAVIEKDEQGNVTNVQVFKPVDFLKSSNITFGQIEEQQQILTEIVKGQNQNKTIQTEQGENPAKEDDTRE